MDHIEVILDLTVFFFREYEASNAHSNQHNQYESCRILQIKNRLRRVVLVECVPKNTKMTHKRFCVRGY